MLSPMMTVAVLAVLWLIVVVPMVVKRKDDRAGERSVARFGGAMQALSVRRTLANLARPVPNFDDGLDAPRPAKRFSRPQIFIPGRRMGQVPSSRVPQPAAMQAIMHPDRVAKADMSEARKQMMQRRRRSLTTLAMGLVLSLGWLLAAGGTIAMLAAMAFSVGLFGYAYFLRSQALRDRTRRESRIQRVAVNASSYEASERFAGAANQTESLMTFAGGRRPVQIDDDDVALLGIAETVDLTGLYSEDYFDEPAMRRAV